MPIGTPHDDDQPYVSNLSGNSYVAARLKTDGRDFVKLRIRSARTCGHLHTICVSCARIWDQDWHLLWERTGGGRNLKAAIEARDETRL